MADITITANSVAKGSDAVIETGTAGATITAGQTVYKDTTDSDKIKLADANASSATATLKGIALHAAISGQPVSYQIDGTITIGASVTKGMLYVLSANAGGIAPSADLASGWYTCVVGVATTTGIIDVMINNTGVTTT